MPQSFRNFAVNWVRFTIELTLCKYNDYCI